MSEALLLDLGGVLYDGEVAVDGAAAERALMVGDDVFGDIEGALGAGIPACLVRTGKYRRGDEERVDGRFHLVDSVVQAGKLALQD